MHNAIRERLKELKRVLEFTITEEHLKLLKRNFVDWEDCETGAPAINCKRPYGNSDVANDVAEILEWPVDYNEELSEDVTDHALRLHAETQTVLQICLSTQSFLAGKYVRPDSWSATSWKRVSEEPPPPPIELPPDYTNGSTIPDWLRDNLKFY